MWCDLYLGESVGNWMWHFQFSIWLKCSLGEVHFAENPTWISPLVSRLWAIEDSQNNRNLFFLLAISHNQCCRLPTDSTRSQHIWKNSKMSWAVWHHHGSLKWNVLTLSDTIQQVSQLVLFVVKNRFHYENETADNTRNMIQKISAEVLVLVGNFSTHCS